MSTDAPSTDTAVSTASSAPTPTTAARIASRREVSLSGAKAWAGILIVLGIANGAAGIIIGTRITEPAHDFLGNIDGTKLSPTGAAFIANAIGVGVILVIAGAIVVCFANALKPDSNLPVR